MRRAHAALLLLLACTGVQRARASDAAGSAAVLGPAGDVQLAPAAAAAFSQEQLDAARDVSERHRVELAGRREQAHELYRKAEALRARRLAAFPLRPARPSQQRDDGGADVDPQEIVGLYRLAAGLRAGPGSAAAASALARMCEWGWDGVGDLALYEPAGLRRRGGGSGVEGWHAALLASSPGAWLAAHVPGFHRLVRWLGGVDAGALLRRLWAPLAAPAGSGGGTAGGAEGSDAASPGESGSAARSAWVVPFNMSCAVEWHAQAAALGNASSQFVMGVLHAHGLFGVPPSEPAALTHWVFAALGGSAKAAVALGHRHATGDGVPKSCASAVAYLEAPARARADAVAASVGLLQAAPTPVHVRLSDSTYEALASEALRGEGQVVTYYHTAAERGDTNAHVALAHMYLLGVRGVAQDLPAAAEHFHAAAETSEPLSLANLGYMYLHGLGVERNPTLAREFIKVPVEAGLNAALTTLGYMYLTGQGEVRDGSTAASLFKRAAEAGHADAHYNLAMMYLEGTGPTGRELRLAAHHFKAAATGGHVQGAYAMGAMAAHGLGGPVDCQAALAAYRGVLTRLPQAHALANGHELLADGKHAAALLAYASAAELGLEIGQWNAAWLLDRGLVPGAAPAVEATDEEAPRATAAAEAAVGSSAASADGGSARATEQPGTPSSSSAASPSANATTVTQWLVELAAHTWSASIKPWVLPQRRTSLSPPGARRRALRLYARSASAGNAWADVVLADAHLGGVAGLPVDAPAAAERYMAACNAHVPDACFAVGWLYDSGHGLARDLHLAKRYYDLALEKQKAHRLVGAGAPVKIMLARVAARQAVARVAREVLLPWLRRNGLERRVSEQLPAWAHELLLPSDGAVAGGGGGGGAAAAAASSAPPVASAAPGSGSPAAAAAAASEGGAATAAPPPADAAESVDAGSSDGRVGGGAQEEGGDAAPGEGADPVTAALARARAAREARQRAGGLAEALNAAWGALAALAKAWAATCADAAHAGVQAAGRAAGVRAAASFSRDDSLLVLACGALTLTLLVRNVRRQRAAARAAAAAAPRPAVVVGGARL